MRNAKRTAAAAAVAAGLLGGGAAGLIMGGTTVSGAQETTTTVASGTPAPEQRVDDRPTNDDDRPDPSDHFTEALAPLVQDGTITQAQADAVIAALADAGPPEGGHRGPGGAERHRGGPGLDAAAGALGISTEELRSSLQGGSTIAQVARDKGVEVQKVIDAMVADFAAHLDDEVAAGEHTREEADRRLAEMTEHITDLVENGPPSGNGGPMGGPRD